MNAQIIQRTDGEWLELDLENTNERKCLKAIVAAFGEHQYGSMSIQGRLTRITIPVRLLNRPTENEILLRKDAAAKGNPDLTK